MSSTRTNPARSLIRTLAAAAAVSAVLLALTAGGASAQAAKVTVVSDASGSKLQVDGRDFMVIGMNWGYVPIGQNYAYSLWIQPDDVIEDALGREMPLLQSMGVNAIRQYVGIPPRWVEYIHDNWGIFTILNHPCARYGITLDGVWIPAVDYSDPRVRGAVKSEIVAAVEEFRDTRGLLMWLLGNENNYGLTWSSFEIEALPEGERHAARARYLYSMFGEAIDEIHARDRNRPVAIANGDLQYIDLIAEECPSLDILGSNVYRGISARDFFQEIHNKLGVPAFFTEFGADAWNAKEMREDQTTQARYLVGQWKEIYEQSYGKGRVGNAIGGIIFQWSDGWWKYLQESRLDIHDTNASWPNAGYPEDYVEGQNNMNEEWWGICAKGPPDSRTLYNVYPRAAYYALSKAFRLDPYARGTDLATIRAHFDAIQPVEAEMEARGDRASLLVDSLSRARLSGLRIEFETYSTGGSRTSTPERAGAATTSFPAFQGFDRMQSFYADFQADPMPNVTGKLSLNVLGRVPVNPIDEIFYENRGRSRVVQTDQGEFELQGVERVKVYQASVSWDDRWFLLDGFYRTGHLHWQYEGDFFGLYRDAYYGENVDIYNGEAPVGVEIHAKKELQGLAIAFGPELWWGANPAFVAKYQRRLGPFDWTAMFHEDIAPQSSVTTSIAVPQPETRKATLQVAGDLGSLGIPQVGFELGGIWSGDTKVDELFQIADPQGESFRVLQDTVKVADTFGFKAKLTAQRGRWNWYAQGAVMGLVAEGGPTSIPTYTGWTLKDSGSGNQSNFLTGLAANFGKFQIAPNFLYQKPIVGPVPGDVPAPGRPRNILDDPFAVRANRETVGFELLLTYDQTPATWMWHWDNDLREDARLAASLGFVYRDLKSTQDAAIGILGDGRTTFAFPGAPPPREMWEVNARIVSRLRPDIRLVAHLFAGEGEPNGDDARLVRRAGGDARIGWGSVAFDTFVKVNDWGPYDYHRDFNLTFPLQLMGDLSYTLGAPRWFGFPQTRLGVRGTWRSLDEDSPRFCPDLVPDVSGNVVCDPLAPGENGDEWEIRTYLHFAM